MASEAGAAKRKAQKNRERAAELKRMDVERVTGRCAQCYAIVSVDSRKSRYRHICRG